MTAQTHEFQTEVKQLLDLMIHSLYTHKDVFLRELISNASDALDKLRFEALTDASILPEGDLVIFLEANPEKRTLTVRDNGIGMTRAEVIDNIGTIARSGTKEFVAQVKQAKDTAASLELIGQFGVGFYASFMVADRVELLTRKAGEEHATRWLSDGSGTYTIEDAQRDSCGTTITLHLKEADEEDGLSNYLEEWTLRSIVKKYSDFVTYPIRMEVERTEPAFDDEGKPVEGAEPKQVKRIETLNSMKAIWTRSEAEVSEDEYKEFYKHVSHDWSDPFSRIAAKLEGTFEAKLLLFLPAKAPFDLYFREAKRGVQLYVRRVFIMDDCKDLVPDYLRFVRGVVDAEDLSLNVSREMLQQNRQVQAIRKFLVKKVLDHLDELLKEDREKYVTFWQQFGAVLKEGLLDFREKHERILDLTLCESTHSEGKPIPLSEVVDRMDAEQDTLYFITGPNRETLASAPHLEAFKEKGLEVVFFTDRVDEVWLEQASPTYREKRFQSVTREDLALGTEEEQAVADEKRKEREQEFKDLLTCLASHLEDHIKEVRLSKRLANSPACVVNSSGDIPPQLAAAMRQAGQPVPKVKRILEVNSEHPILERLQAIFKENKEDERLTEGAELLYGQAILAAGGELPDPAAFGKRIAELMARAYGPI